MSIVQLEDARATWSVSCPIALWDYSRSIVAVTRLCKLRNWEKFSSKQSHSVIPWMSLIMMSIVQLEDARATWSVSCPIALWDYSRDIVAITRLCKKLEKKFSKQSHSAIRRNTDPDSHATSKQHSFLFFCFTVVCGSNTVSISKCVVDALP